MRWTRTSHNITRFSKLVRVISWVMIRLKHGIFPHFNLNGALETLLDYIVNRQIRQHRSILISMWIPAGICARINHEKRIRFWRYTPGKTFFGKKKCMLTWDLQGLILHFELWIWYASEKMPIWQPFSMNKINKIHDFDPELIWSKLMNGCKRTIPKVRFGSDISGWSDYPLCGNLTEHQHWIVQI